jgi:hypothetical protein
LCYIQIYIAHLLKGYACEVHVAGGDTSNKITSLNRFPEKADINTEAILKIYELFNCGILIHFEQMC